MVRPSRSTAPKVTELIPLSLQINSFEITRQQLAVNPVHINLSPVGTGKTYLALKMALDYNLPIVVFTVKSTITMWNNTAQLYGVKFAKVNSNTIDYGARTYDGASKGTVADLWEQYEEVIKSGALFIFDEFQRMKNANINLTQSIANMIRRIIKLGGKSRIIMMSATPIDMPHQCVSTLYALGLVDHLVSINPDGNFRISAEEEARADEAAKKNRKAAQTLLTKNNKRLSDYIVSITDRYKDRYKANTLYLFHFFRLYVIPTIGGRMPAIKKAGIVQDVINISVKVYDRNYSNVLVKVTKKLDEDDSVTGTSANFTKLLKEIERMKIPEFVTLTMKELIENPMRKVAVAVNFIDTLHSLALALFMFNPLVIEGDVGIKKRGSKIAKFQEHNTNNRLILFTTPTGSVGITLDDQYGDMPRTLVLSPGVGIIHTIQAIGRVMRAETASSPRVYIVYGYTDNSNGLEASTTELNIRNRLEMKSTNVESILHHAPSPDDQNAESIVRTLTDTRYQIVDEEGNITEADDLRKKQNARIRSRISKAFNEEKKYIERLYY